MLDHIGADLRCAFDDVIITLAVKCMIKELDTDHSKTISKEEIDELMDKYKNNTLPLTNDEAGILQKIMDDWENDTVEKEIDEVTKLFTKTFFWMKQNSMIEESVIMRTGPPTHLNN